MTTAAAPLRLPKEWILPEISPHAEAALRDALDLPAPIARVLVGRGLADPAAAEAFLRAEVADLESPFLMKDMEKAVRRLLEAAARKEKVFVRGDSDVDGTSAAALLDALLTFLRIPHETRVPAGRRSYGFSPGAAKEAADFGATLVITVDCGIRDHEGVSAAKAAGCDVIVLDHHEPARRAVTQGGCAAGADDLPPAYAVVDPHRADCPYPFKGLSACGIAFKFAQAVLLARDPFFDREIVCFDFETNGSSKTSEILEIGAVKARHGIVVDRFHRMVRPEGPLDSEAARVHGITFAEVDRADGIEKVLPEFLEFVGDATLAGHNVEGFDLPILQFWAHKILGRKIDNPVIDTLKEARRLFPGRSHALPALSAGLGLDHARLHRADADAEVAFQLLKKIILKRNPEVNRFLSANLDLVTLSTVADVVPLLGENRVFVSLGLAALAKPRRPGVAELLAQAVRNPPPRAKDLSWSVIPLLNSAGRANRAHETYELFTTRSRRRAREIVARLVALNEARKAKQKASLEVIHRRLAESFDPERDVAVVEAFEDLERGVTGILAGRLVRDLGRPVVLLLRAGDRYGGTSRGVEGLDLIAALESAEDLLDSFGGHAGAAVLSLPAENLEAFKVRFAEYVRENCPPEALRPRLTIDAEVFIEELSPELAEGIERLEPTGFGNDPPVFFLRGAEVVEAKAVGAEKQHLRLTVRAGSGGREAVFLAWNYWGDPDDLPAGTKVDLAFTCEPEEERWGGNGLRMLLEDLRVAA